MKRCGRQPGRLPALCLKTCHLVTVTAIARTAHLFDQDGDVVLPFQLAISQQVGGRAVALRVEFSFGHFLDLPLLVKTRFNSTTSFGPYVSPYLSG
jgi:hypothetical protein